MNKHIAALVAVCSVEITHLHCLFNRVPISSSAQNKCLPNQYNSYIYQGVIYLAEEGQINVCSISFHTHIIILFSLQKLYLVYQSIPKENIWICSY